ncbi:hypothetical protein OF117_11675 [Geodermatophilus sp. YIM 151500]|uniref:hypothetical protein n=1 Tax=Geodermatophilus sp. YIM 151500 TaxID=2984531 RepID=UPI0021E3C6ED|nr:hypothetical protein [Geodermatophilus sp. YIM 151500]MCV2490020.1 hypothetical protein [Geodermatophilus sp. YIM 151500]
MPYSLVSAATLGFDLVRVPAGRQVADTLLTGLLADAAILARLAEAHPGRGLDRDQRGALAVRSRKARELAAAAPTVRGVAGPTTGADRTAVLVAQLEQGTLGDAPTLERLLREDVLGPGHPAVTAVEPEVSDAAADVLADAAVGWWAAGVLPPLVRRELTEPFERASDVAPPAAPIPDLGPGGDRLHALFTALGGLDDAGRAAWRIAVDEGRAERRPWATAMHEASWAAHVSGRTRALATAQLCAVLAFVDGGFGARDGAHGVWNAVAGCVQGLAMADLLDEASLATLTAPLARLGW